MAQYTEHFGLHQWESADPFLRTDFNQDLETIDAALGRTARSTEANAYNLYNLMLQSYYEGKYTGYRRGMLLSTFREPGSFTKSPELVLSGGCLSLYGQGQGDIDLGYVTSGSDGVTNLTTPQQQPAGGGTWTGFTGKVFNNTSGQREFQVTFHMLLNGVEQESVTLSTGTMSARSSMELHGLWNTPVIVGEKDTCSVRVTSGNAYCLVYYCPDGSGAGGVFHFTPISGETGWVRAVEPQVPAATQIQAWVRHAGGTVSLAVTDDGGTAHTLSPAGQTQTQVPEGVVCTESAFTGTGDFAAGEWTVKLDAARNSDEKMTVFDYGVIFR